MLKTLTKSKGELYAVDPELLQQQETDARKKLLFAEHQAVERLLNEGVLSHETGEGRQRQILERLEALEGQQNREVTTLSEDSRRESSPALQLQPQCHDLLRGTQTRTPSGHASDPGVAKSNESQKPLNIYPPANIHRFCSPLQEVAKRANLFAAHHKHCFLLHSIV